MSVSSFLFARALEARTGGPETLAESIAKMDEVAKVMSIHHEEMTKVMLAHASAVADLVESLRNEDDYTDECVIEVAKAEHGEGYQGIAPGTYAIPAEYLVTTGLFPVGDKRLTDLPEYATVTITPGRQGYENFLSIAIIAPFKCKVSGYRFDIKEEGKPSRPNPLKGAAVKAEQVILGLVYSHPRSSKISDDFMAPKVMRNQPVSEATRAAVLARMAR